MRTRLFIATAATAVVAATSTVTQAQQPSLAGWVSCDFTGTAHVSPGITLTAQPVRFTSDVIFTNCTASDPSVTNGTARTIGTLTGSCAEATGQATQQIRWANHQRSTLDATFTNVGSVEVTQETVTRGEFTGAAGGNENTLLGSPGMLSDCAGSGVTTAQFSGQIVLLGPPA